MTHNQHFKMVDITDKEQPLFGSIAEFIEDSVQNTYQLTVVGKEEGAYRMNLAFPMKNGPVKAKGTYIFEENQEQTELEIMGFLDTDEGFNFIGSYFETYSDGFLGYGELYVDFQPECIKEEAELATA